MLRVYFDTSVILYAHSMQSQMKEERAIYLLESEEHHRILGTQSLNETSVQLLKKFKRKPTEVNQVVTSLVSLVDEIAILQPITILKAISIHAKYKYHFFDSLQIAAALEYNAKVLFSEDMQDGHLIEKKLEIVNPFSR